MISTEFINTRKYFFPSLYGKYNDGKLIKNLFKNILFSKTETLVILQAKFHAVSSLLSVLKIAILMLALICSKHSHWKWIWPEHENTVNLKSAFFVIIMLLHEGLIHINSQVAFWREFHLKRTLSGFWPLGTLGRSFYEWFPVSVDAPTKAKRKCQPVNMNVNNTLRVFYRVENALQHVCATSRIHTERSGE